MKSMIWPKVIYSAIYTAAERITKTLHNYGRFFLIQFIVGVYCNSFWLILYTSDNISFKFRIKTVGKLV